MVVRTHLLEIEEFIKSVLGGLIVEYKRLQAEYLLLVNTFKQYPLLPGTNKREAGKYLKAIYNEISGFQTQDFVKEYMDLLSIWEKFKQEPRLSTLAEILNSYILIGYPGNLYGLHIVEMLQRYVKLINVRDLTAINKLNELQKKVEALCAAYTYRREKIKGALRDVERQLSVSENGSEKKWAHSTKQEGQFKLSDKIINLKVIIRDLDLRKIRKYIAMYYTVPSDQDIKRKIADTLFYLTEKALKNNLFLIRASRTNIQIVVKRLEQNIGQYLTDKSNFPDIFIELNENLFERILLRHHYDSQSAIVTDVIVHELSHAYDWRLNANKNCILSLYELLKEESTKATYEFARVLEETRTEGFARLVEYIHSSLAQGRPLLVRSLLLNAESHLIPEVKKLFVNISASPEFREKAIADYQRNHLKYTYGVYVALIILIVKLKDCIKLYGQWDTLLSLRDVQKKLLMVYQISISWEDYPKLKNVLTLISLMTPLQYLQAYVESCKVLGISPEPFSPETFKDIQKQSKAQDLQYLQNEGFEVEFS